MTRTVAAAVFIKDGKVMICRRPPGKGNALKWEFPGGKTEPGETLADCLKRECKEELNIDISVGSEICSNEYTYPDITVVLHFMLSGIVSGEPELIEHTELKWVAKDELDSFDFCPADEKIVHILKDGDFLD